MKHAREDYQTRIIDTENRIPADEPVYLFRGQDMHASTVLRFYANLVESGGGDPNVVSQTRAHADLMDQWPNKKQPDITP